MTDKIYVVEVKFGKKHGGCFLPTASWHISREAARQDIREWKSKLSGATYQIVKYRNPKVVR